MSAVGSGKTYTMQGEENTCKGMTSSSGMIGKRCSASLMSGRPEWCYAAAGRAVQHIFAAAASERENGWSSIVSVEILEIYNESIRDLLSEVG